MPSIAELPDRHVVVDRRTGEYLSFPDICRAADGRLLLAYRQADAHVGARRKRLLLRTSTDDGRSWSNARILHPTQGHCPRLSLLPDDDIVLLDDDGPFACASSDHGVSFERHAAHGLAHGLPDRVLVLDKEHWLTTGHLHRGRAAWPGTGQPPTEQMAYTSQNRGLHWQPLSLLAAPGVLVLCEGSLTLLPDGRVLGLLRENSGVGEPMYAVLSADQGATWTTPRPTPLIGHRPTVSVLGPEHDHKVLVTYRDLGPDPCTAAWVGTLDELLGDFQVHGLHGDGQWYALRPVSQTARARGVLRLRVAVDEGTCRVRFAGHALRITSHGVELEGREPLELGVELVLTLDGPAKKLEVSSAGHILELPVDVDDPAARIIGLGDDLESPGGWTLHGADLEIMEPGLDRKYRWSWRPEDGRPDAWVRARVLRLAEPYGAWGGDFGYSGWCALDSGEFLCAYHHADGRDPEYVRGRTCFIQVTRFSLADWT